jgi:hypothetical protein
VYSEKASHHGLPGIGHPRFATTADGGPLALAVTGLYGRNHQPTRVMALDSGRITALNGGTWPATPEQLRDLVRQNPEVVLADHAAQPPQLLRMDGVAAGTRVTVLTGAEALFDDPPRTPAPAMAMVVPAGALPREQRQALGLSGKGAPSMHDLSERPRRGAGAGGTGGSGRPGAASPGSGAAPLQALAAQAEAFAALLQEDDDDEPAESGGVGPARPDAHRTEEPR